MRICLACSGLFVLVAVILRAGPAVIQPRPQQAARKPVSRAQEGPAKAALARTKKETQNALIRAVCSR